MKRRQVFIDGTPVEKFTMTEPKYMALVEWRKEYFVKPPHHDTCVRWLVNGTVPGKKIGRQWFVDVNAEVRNSGNALIDAVLNQGGS